MEIPKREEIQSALEMRHTKPIQEKISKAQVAVCGLGGLLPLPWRDAVSESCT